jgi:hypothetical protein
MVPVRHAVADLGYEREKVRDGPVYGATVSSMDRVRTLSLDHYFAEEGITSADFVSIDIEGSDIIALEGLEASLRNGLVRVLEFESTIIPHVVKHPGPWGKRNIETVVERLGGYSFVCFWQGNHGCLARISPPCWRRTFEIRAWSNVVCCREQPLVSALMGIADECEASTFHPRRPADLKC